MLSKVPGQTSLITIGGSRERDSAELITFHYPYYARVCRRAVLNTAPDCWNLQTPHLNHLYNVHSSHHIYRARKKNNTTQSTLFNVNSRFEEKISSMLIVISFSRSQPAKKRAKHDSRYILSSTLSLRHCTPLVLICL